MPVIDSQTLNTPFMSGIDYQTLNNPY